MLHTPLIRSIIVLLLLAAVLAAGCSSTSSSSQNTAGTSKAPVSTAVGSGGTPLYSAGDIVRMPGSDPTSAWLVTGYDKASDRYTRAFLIRQGSDWFRTDTSTETILRATMEKTYTTRITSVDVSSVKVGAPVALDKSGAGSPDAGSPGATPIPADAIFDGTGYVSTSSPGTESATVTATVTATMTRMGTMKVLGITPDTGLTNSVVKITSVKGTNFAEGAKVKLTLANASAIEMTDVKVVSSSQITGTVTIPKDADLGAYSIVVTNPDGQTSTYANYFTVRRGSSESSSESGYSPDKISITSIFPAGVQRDNSVRIKNLAGNNFQNGATVKITRDGEDDIEATDVIVEGSVKITCVISVPLSVASGPWNLVVTNPDGTSATKVGGFAVMS